jgi:hypothetical protein
MLDAVWDEMTGGPPAAQGLAPLLRQLRGAEVPFSAQVPSEGAAGAKGTKKRPKGQQ